MIFGLLAALAAQPTLAAKVPAGRIEIPPAIAPAVIPYLQCTVRQHNAALGRIAGSAENLPVIRAEVLAACAQVRARALGEGERLLRGDRQFPDADRRRAFVEASLSTVEGTIDQVHAAAPPGRPNR